MQKASDNLPIGIFDSGVGGLTVMKEIVNLLPEESIVYLGDTARVPYGIRSAGTVIKYSLEMADFLISRGIKLLVIACNTSSAFALEEITKKYDIPVVGVIEPGAKRALEATKVKKIGIIGTEGTIKSNSYVNAINELYGNRPLVIRQHGTIHYDRYFEISLDDFIIFTKACPLFVPLVEEGWAYNDVAALTAKLYLEGLLKEHMDVLVLGCTHYPLLKGVISEVMGDDIVLVDSALETAREIKDILRRHGIERTSPTETSRAFYVTDSPERFTKVGERFLGHKIKYIEKIEVGG